MCIACHNGWNMSAVLHMYIHGIMLSHVHILEDMYMYVTARLLTSCKVESDLQEDFIITQTCNCPFAQKSNE